VAGKAPDERPVNPVLRKGGNHDLQNANVDVDCLCAFALMPMVALARTHQRPFDNPGEGTISRSSVTYLRRFLSVLSCRVEAAIRCPWRNLRIFDSRQEHALQADIGRFRPLPFGVDGIIILAWP